MTEFTDEFIKQQRELMGKATPRPWGFYDAFPLDREPGIVCAQRLGTKDTTVIKACPCGEEIHVIEADAEYLHAATNHYPEALDEIDRLRAQVVEFARTELLRVMEEISEEAYCAGWMDGLEWACMDMVKGALSGYGMVSVADYREKLTMLHDLCGGWWIWKDDVGPVFTVDAQICNYKAESL